MPAFHFYLSSSYLCRIFKDSTGTTINQYITAKRISRAKVLLAEGHPVAEDSSLCGFGDYSNFLPAKSGQKDGSSKGFQEENEITGTWPNMSWTGRALWGLSPCQTAVTRYTA